MKKTILIISGFIVVAAITTVGIIAVVSNNDNSSTNSNTAQVANNNQTTSGKVYSEDEIDSLYDNVCDLFTKEDIIDYIDSSKSESDIESLAIYGCTYSWEKANAEEIRARNEEIILDTITSGGDILDLSATTESENNQIEVAVEKFSSRESVENTIESFRTVTNQLSDEEKARNSEIVDEVFEDVAAEEGLTESEQEVGDSIINIFDEVSEKDNYVSVDSVGDEAAWSEYSRTLYVRVSNLIFSVTVDVEGERSNEEVAIEVAKLVITRL